MGWFSLALKLNRIKRDKVVKTTRQALNALSVPVDAIKIHERARRAYLLSKFILNQ
jgi:hypothetical protein